MHPIRRTFSRVVPTAVARGRVARGGPLFDPLEPRALFCAVHGSEEVTASTSYSPAASFAAAAQSTPSTSVALRWRLRADAPVRREESQVISAGGKFIVFGGYYSVNNRFIASNRVYAFDPAMNAWTEKNKMPTLLTHAAVAQDGRWVYFVGGFVGDFPVRRSFPGDGPPATSAVWKYDLKTDRWFRGANLPAARGSGNGALVGRNLYFWGGANKERRADSALGYVLNIDRPGAGWKRVASLPGGGRNHFGAAAVDGRIYAIGGQYGLEEDGRNTSRVDVYDPATNTWSSGTPLPRKFSHFASSTVTIDREIVLIAGEEPHDVAVSWAYAYNPSRDNWRRVTELPAPRRAGVAAVVDGNLIQFGGYERDRGQTPTTWVADVRTAF